MSPLIMYMTSSLGSLWNSLRNSRPRATNAMLSGAYHSTVLGRPEPLIVVMTCPRLTAFSSSMANASNRAGTAKPRDLLVPAHQLTWGAPKWPPAPPNVRSAPGHPWRSSIGRKVIIVLPSGQG